MKKINGWAYDDKIDGGKQYALVYLGQKRAHEIVGRNKEFAIEKALKIAKKERVDVIITKEVGVIRKRK